MDAACRQYTKTYENREIGLMEWVSEYSATPLDEQAFFDTVSRSLAAGEFKVLIVGEGIREQVESLAEFLQNAPHLRFGLELVELSCWYLGEDEGYPYLLIPRVVARTREIERAVVRVLPLPTELKEKIEVKVEAPAVKPGAPAPRPPTLTEEEFYDKLAANTSEGMAGKVREFVEKVTSNLGVEADFGATNLLLKFRSPADPSQRCTALNFGIRGNVGRGGEIARTLGRWNMSTAAADEYVRAMNAIYAGFHGNRTAKGYYGYPAVAMREVIGKLPQIEDALGKLIEGVAAESSQT